MKNINQLLIDVNEIIYVNFLKFTSNSNSKFINLKNIEDQFINTISRNLFNNNFEIFKILF